MATALNLKKALLFYLSFLSKGSEVITSIVLASFDWLTSWVDPKNGGQFQGHVWEHFGIPLCDMLVADVAVAVAFSVQPKRVNTEYRSFGILTEPNLIVKGNIGSSMCLFLL